MELWRILGPLRINPVGRDKEREVSGGERVCNRVAQGRPQETPLGFGLLPWVLVPLLLEGLEGLLVVAPHHFLDPASGVGDDPGDLLGGNLLGTRAQLVLGETLVFFRGANACTP